MSLINQVLNELEKRGADAPLGKASIRAVPQRERRKWPAFLFLAAVVLLVMLAALGWRLGRKEAPMPEPATVVAVPVIAQSGAAPALAAAVESAPAAASAIAAAEPYGMNMSHELHSVPLHGKPLLEVAQAEEPVAAPVVKKTAASEPGAVNKVAAKSTRTVAESPVHGPFKKISPQQHAENEFRKANLAAQEGRTDDALAGYEGVLRLNPLHHAARRAWVGVLLGLKRNGDAERVLQDGLMLDAHEASLAMLLARLQVERGAVPLALETLQKNLPDAERQADYQAFVAALLQRQERHKEAVMHYQVALQLAPNNGVWLMGMGISLQALQHNQEARDAYQRALASNSLSPQLQVFVEKKLKEL